MVTTRQLAEAEAILSDPGGHGGVDSELWMWAAEVVERLSATRGGSKSLGTLHPTTVAQSNFQIREIERFEPLQT
jgi:hypothetical protein